MRSPAVSAMLAVLCVALLAGCAGVADSGSERPEWVAADGETVNATALTESHAEGLSAAGNYTTDREALVSLPADAPEPNHWRPNQSARSEFDLEAQRRLVVRDGPRNRTVRAFVDGDRRYVLEERSDGATYRTGEAGWEYVGPDALGKSLFGDWNLTYEGPTERGGETLHRVTGDPPADYDRNVLDTVEGGSIELLVADTGVIRQHERRLTGTTEAGSRPGETETIEVTYVTRYRYEAVGETTVEEPDWVEAARESG
jgi:hypothetical protein